MKYRYLNLTRWILLLGIPVLALLACNNNDRKVNSKTIAAAKTDSSNNRKMELPERATETYLAELVSRREAIAKQLPGISEAGAVALYRSLAVYVDTVLAGIQENESNWLDKYGEYYKEENGKVKLVLPVEVQKRIALLAPAGLDVQEMGEGYTGIVTVPHFYTGLFKNSLPADYRKYLQLQSAEDSSIYSVDGGLAVAFHEIGKRVLNWEQFLLTYPNSDFVASANERYRMYLRDFLFGDDNTPAFEQYDDIKTIIPENKKEYIAFTEKNAGTRSALIVKRYLEKLETENSVSSLETALTAAIDHIFLEEPALLPAPADLGPVEIELMVGSVYDTLPKIDASGAPLTEKLERHLDTVIYLQQAGSSYGIAVFSNSIKDGEQMVSGWMDIWAFKNENGEWKRTARLLHAGGGSGWGGAGYFGGIRKMGTNATGILLTGSQNYGPVNNGWTDMIEFSNEKLTKVLSIMDYFREATEKGGTKTCKENKWVLQKNGQKDHYDLVVVPTSCTNASIPLKRLSIPYANGYPLPKEYGLQGN